MAITPPRQKIAFQVCCHLTPVILYACHLSVICFALDKKAKFRPIFGHNSLVVNIIRDSSPFCNCRSFQKMCDSSHTFWDFVY